MESQVKKRQFILGDEHPGVLVEDPINNSGPAKQINFILDELGGVDGIVEIIKHSKR